MHLVIGFGPPLKLEKPKQIFNLSMIYHEYFNYNFTNLIK